MDLFEKMVAAVAVIVLLAVCSATAPIFWGMVETAMMLSAVIAGGFVSFLLLGLGWFAWEGYQDRQHAQEIDRRQIAIDEARSQLVYAGLHGEMPLSLMDVVQGAVRDEVLMLQSQMHDSRKTFAPVPNSIHYSVSNSNENFGELGEGLEVQMPQMPTYTELRIGGKMPSDERMLLGRDCDDGEYLSLSPSQIGTGVIVGNQGTGKSTLVRSIILQAIDKGNRVLMIDPEVGNQDSLADSLKPLVRGGLIRVASSPQDICLMASEVQEAAVGQGRQDVLFVVDEATRLCRTNAVSDAICAALEAVNWSGRKRGVFAYILGQNFNSKVIPTEIRDTFMSMAVFHGSRNCLGDMLPGEEKTLVSKLPKYHFYFVDTDGQGRVLQVPNTTDYDVELVAGSSSQGSSESSSEVLPTLLPSSSGFFSEEPQKNLRRTSEEPQKNPEEPPEQPSYLDLRVWDRLRRGESKNKIYKDLLRGEMGTQRAFAYIGEVNERLGALS